MRLQKFLAEAGVASRRAAEALITAGRVVVNGAPVTRLGSQVDPASDRVAVDGAPVRPRRKLYVALNKPCGYLCTRHDPAARQTVGALLPKEWSALYPVGRLDRDSEGLLFLTNDGDFCLRLTHPRFGVAKTYIAEVQGRVDPPLVPRFTRGVQDGADRLRADRARLLKATNTASLIELVLREGKNREVRRLCAALGLQVLSLRRTRIGPIGLGELPVGRWRVLRPQEVRTLLTGAAVASAPRPGAAAGGTAKGVQPGCTPVKDDQAEAT
jgi:pseudouridine synthase